MGQKKEMFPSFSPEELMDLLVEHAKVYNTKDDGDEILSITYSQGATEINPEGPEIRINPEHDWRVKEELGLTERQAIRVLLDSLSHEIEHYKRSDLESKGEFMERFPSNPKLAGAVMNIVEDCYIDNKRVKEFEGLQLPYEWSTQAKLPNFLESIGEKGLKEDLIAVLVGVGRGEIGFPGKLNDPLLREFARRATEQMEKVPEADTQEERMEIAEKLTSTIMKLIPEPEKPPEVEMLEELLDEIVQEIAEELGEELEELPSEQIELMEEGEADRIEEEAIEIEADPEEYGEEEEEAEVEEEEEVEKQSTNKAEVEEVEENEEVDEVEEPDDSGDPNSSGQGLNHGSQQKKRQKWQPAEEGETETGIRGGHEDVDFTLDLEDPRWGRVSGNTNQGVFDPETSTDTAKVENTRTVQKEGEELSERVEEILEDLSAEETREVKAHQGSNLSIRSAVRKCSGNPSEKAFRKEVKETDTSPVGVTLDASGSMNAGNKMKNGLLTIKALGEATKKLGAQFTANTFWQTTDTESGVGQECNTTTITGINEEFHDRDIEGVTTHGYDPMALGMEEAIDGLEQAEQDGGILFAITDGNPGIEKDPDSDTIPKESAKDEAVEEAIEEKRRAEQQGIEVVGIAVGQEPNEETMDEIFGDSWFRFDGDELAEKILTVYRNKTV